MSAFLVHTFKRDYDKLARPLSQHKKKHTITYLIPPRLINLFRMISITTRHPPLELGALQILPRNRTKKLFSSRRYTKVEHPITSFLFQASSYLVATRLPSEVFRSLWTALYFASCTTAPSILHCIDSSTCLSLMISRFSSPFFSKHGNRSSST